MKEATVKKYTIGLYEKAMPSSLSWRDKLFIAKEAGYDFVEISIDETEERLSRLDWSKGERFELVETMYDVGMPIHTMCLSGHRKYPLGSSDEMMTKRGIEIFQKALLLASDLGIHIVQLAGYDVYYEKSTKETKARFQDNLKKLVQMASSIGITLGIETMDTEFIDTVEKAMLYIREIESPYFNIYPDCGNITNAAVKYGKNVTDDIEKGKGRMVAMHLKETGPGIFRNLLYGQGHVEFDKIIQKAWSMGIRKYVTEFWYQRNRNWRCDVVKSNQRMRAILDKQA